MERTFWVTGAYDFTVANLYEVSPAGQLLNTYLQPPANWGFWGWRDLAFDGLRLYAGDDSNLPGYITEIDPATGQVTGNAIGPLPLTICRALAHEKRRDRFWTASFTSDFICVARDGTYQAFLNPGLAVYGMAMEERDPAHPKLWVITASGTGSKAVEFDLSSATPTGKSFDITGGSRGTCAYDAGGGSWVLVVLTDGKLEAYDLDTPESSLRIAPDVLDAGLGGTVTFELDAGISQAGRYYVMLGSVNGSEPGTPLPKGGPLLPINWDPVTNLLLDASLPGFAGTLDNQGQATITLPVPAAPDLAGLELTFAYPLAGPPWDFASDAAWIFFR